MDISEILARFPEVPQSDWTDTRASQDGLINSTWFVGEHFVLQKVNPLFGPAVNDDIAVITQALRDKGIPAPRLLQSAQGAYCDEVVAVREHLAHRVVIGDAAAP